MSMTPEEEKAYAESLAQKIVDNQKIVDKHGTELAEAKGQMARVEADIKAAADKHEQEKAGILKEVNTIKDGWKTLEEGQKSLEELIKTKLRPIENPEDMSKKDMAKFHDLWNKMIKSYSFEATNRPDMSDQYKMDAEEIQFYAKHMGVEATAQSQFIKNVATKIPGETKAMSTYNVNRAGALLTPPVHMGEILDTNRLEISTLSQFARKHMMGPREMSLVWPRQTVHGAARWINETGTRTEDEATKFGTIQLNLNQCYAMHKVTQAMLNFSSIDLAGYMRTEFTRAFNYLWGVADITGSAVGQPEGVLVNPDIEYVNAEETGDITTIDYLGLLLFSMKEYYRANSRYAMNSNTAWRLSKLKGADGQPLLRVWTEAPVFTLMGRPITIQEAMPNVASGSVPIVIGNWAEGYLSVDSNLGTLQIVDIYTEAAQGIVVFILNTWREGKVIIPEGFKKFRMSITTP